MESERARKFIESQLASLENRLSKKLASSQRGNHKGSGRGWAPVNEGQNTLRARNGEAKESRRGSDGQGKQNTDLGCRRPGTSDYYRPARKITAASDTRDLQMQKRARQNEQIKCGNWRWQSWEKNFYTLKDEFFVRHSLQRQVSVLHHATLPAWNLS